MTLARNVLVFHSGALGDFVLTWPLLLGVARVMPQCRVIVVTGADKGQLAERVLKVESRDVEAGWPALFGDGELAPKSANLFAGSRLILSFVADVGSRWEQNARRLAPNAEVKLLPARPPVGFTGHATDHLLRALENDPILHSAMAGMLDSIRKSGLVPRAHDPTGPLVIHPGSGGRDKNWPIGSWLELIERHESHTRVILGDVEQERLKPSDIAELANFADEVVEPQTLPALLDALTGARGFIGHDTGPTHLAAMLGLPTLALFGPTDPGTWAPVGKNVKVLRHVPLAALPVETVLATIVSD